MSAVGDNMQTKNLSVVDDDIDFLKMSNKILSRSGFNVLTFDRGANFLDFIKKDTTDFIIMDINLKDFNGIEILKILRTEFKDIQTPVVMITGSEADKVECYKLGADDFIKKPIVWKELIAKVRNIIQKNNYLKGLNPLSSLPSSSAIEHYTRRLLEKKDVFVYMYIDIDKFKRINDEFGYIYGDKIIKTLADTLKETTKTYKNVFLGHIGGDDFVVICRWEDWQDIAQKVSNDFNLRIENLKNKKHIDKITLSISCASNKYRRITSYGQIISIVFEIKRYLKSLNHTYTMILMDRRKD